MSSRAAAASRARGSLVLAVFGSLWLAGGVSLYANLSHPPLALLAVVAIAALAIALAVVLFAWRAVTRLKPFAEPWSPAVSRAFWIVNIVQYAALGLVVNLFGHGSRQVWLIPAATAVVGLHFLPLARLFRSPPHAWIGLAMLAVAAAVAALKLPPFSPLGIFGAGAVLLGGAVALVRIAMRDAKLDPAAA